MSSAKESEVLSILQPDLLPVEELIERIQSRCCKIENLGLMSKEGLVGLFRRMILPLPQRFYRTNRRGKMLTSRRAKAGLESRRNEEGCSDDGLTSRLSASNSRPLRGPDSSSSSKIRLKNDRNVSSSKDLDKIVINDRRKLGGNERKEDERWNTGNSGCDSQSSRKITLKRSPADEKPSSDTTSSSERKKQRTAIKWP